MDVPDNITAPVICERFFKKYYVPFYNKLADMLDDVKILLCVHMDGDLKPLWDAIGKSRVGGLDSFSPPPDNDTSVAQAIDMRPDKRLFVNFLSSVHLESPKKIYEVALQILNESKRTGRLWIQISKNVPPRVWKKSYPQIVKAIEEFGRPL